MRVVRLALGVQAVPDRERHAEEPLPGDQPVPVQPADPVVVAVLHVRRHPGQLLAPPQQRLLELGVPAAVADVPLPGGDDLQRLVALLVEVGLPRGRGGLAVEVAGRAQRLDHRLPGREGGQPGNGLPRGRIA